MSDQLNSNSEIKADLTETVNNIYKDALSKPLQSGSAIISTTLDFIHNTIFLPMQKYNLYAEDKLKSFQKELEDKALNIPSSNLVSPRVNILGPAVESLKYNLDEKYIKNMFTNLLISDMDRSKQSKVHPSYIRIINQLSDNDAKFLELLNKNSNGYSPSIQLILSTSDDNDGSFKLDQYIMYNNSSNNLIEKLDPLIADNLVMHRLIDITYDEYFTYPRADMEYKTIFNTVKNQYSVSANDTLSYMKGCVRTTNLGKNFIDICLN